MKIRSLLLATLGALVATASLHAHHPFGAQYDGEKPVRLVGELLKVEWTNPHSYLYLKVKNTQGGFDEWTLESAAPGALSRRGFKKGDIKLGDVLIVDGFLAKSGAKLADARRVTLPDGRTIYGGTAGDGGPASGAPTPPGAVSTPASTPAPAANP